MNAQQKRLIVPMAILALGLVALIGAAYFILASGGQQARGSAIGGPFTLTDQNGARVTDATYRGAPSIVFFGYTHCPDVCPTTLVKLAQVKKTAALAGMQVLFITVDPQRDTPQVVGTYARSFDPSFIGLTGDQAAIDKVTRAFAVAAVRVDLPGGDYTMDHSAQVFLLDSKAQIVGLFSPPFDTRSLAQDLQAVAPRLEARS
jgi:protein SCO1